MASPNDFFNDWDDKPPQTAAAAAKPVTSSRTQLSSSMEPPTISSRRAAAPPPKPKMPTTGMMSGQPPPVRGAPAGRGTMRPVTRGARTGNKNATTAGTGGGGGEVRRKKFASRKPPSAASIISGGNNNSSATTTNSMTSSSGATGIGMNAAVAGQSYYNGSTSTATTSATSTTNSLKTMPNYYTNPASSGATTANTNIGGSTNLYSNSEISNPPSSSGWYDSAAAPSVMNTNTVSNPIHQPQQQQPGIINPYPNAAVSNQPNQFQPQVFQPQQFQQQQQQQQPVAAANTSDNFFLGGIMSNMSTSTPAITKTSMDNTYDDENYEDEPPLLEELGINIEHILMKTKAVVIPSRRLGGVELDPSVIVEDADLIGPLILALLLGAEMLMSAKLQFGFIYGFFSSGCALMTLILNLMAPHDAVSFWTVASVLGYSLLPVNILCLLKLLFINLLGWQTLGRILALLTIAWSTTASTRLLEVGCGMREQRYLLAYPLAMFFSAFVLLTIF